VLERSEALEAQEGLVGDASAAHFLALYGVVTGASRIRPAGEKRAELVFGGDP
jgi:hypothetical protein